VSVETNKVYRVSGPCRLSGQPVNWNARAICWSGADWRAPLRRALHRHGWKLTPSSKIRRWVLAITDDRNRDYRDRYGRSVEVARRFLNTAEDVDARTAGNLAQQYWNALERTGERPDLEALVARYRAD
jgi:hypothetical protein